MISPIPGSTDLVFRKSRRALRMRLQIDPRGQVTLVAPWFSSQAHIRAFFAKHESWLQKHLAKIAQKKALRPAPRYRTGDTFYYFGEPVLLEVVPSERKRPDLKVRAGRMTLSLHRDIGKSEGIQSVKKTLQLFFRKKAEEVIHDRLRHFNEHYGFRYHRVALRDQKSRWGSCSRAGNLNFNWRLIMAPIEVIDYVVVHELCHLGQMNHSLWFWALVEEVMPDHKQHRRWLRENHFMLTI
jgi:predicted metal-dependent hydrolase